ncbi:MAG: hypothetical protein WCT11_04960 [Candidatus Magasanikbacteria bacterium]|jgi:hypothetical protein
MDYKKLTEYIKLIIEAHQEKALKPENALRTFPSGESNPYFTHSLWCAMTILLETKLPESIRLPGSEALLFHDVLEDTSAKLPTDLSQEVKDLVQSMTFDDFHKEVKETLAKPPINQLLKLYDKTATLYDGVVKNKVGKEWYDYLQNLVINVEKEYGELNIVLLAKTLLENR